MLDHHYEDINGIRTHFVTAGSGAPIVFLHGFPEFWGVWSRQLAEFGRSHRVIVPDLRGANETQRPTQVEHYGIDYLVADVRALLDHLDLERATIVAQDWGALIGWSFLLRHPERVERFVTINVTHPALLDRALREDPAQQQASQYMLAFRARGEELIRADDGAFLDRLLFDDARAHGADISAEEQAEWRSIMLDRGHLRAGLNLYRAAELGPPDGEGGEGGSNLVRGLAPARLRVERPVLALAGSDDPYLLPAGFDGLGEYVEDRTVERIAGASHWVSLEKPVEVNAAIRRFITG